MILRHPARPAWASLAGVGLKPQHVRDILAGPADIGFFEVHAENYMGAGGPPHRHLTAIRERYPLSIHGVGLSLGGASELDAAHIDRLAALVRRYQPALVSEHLAWSTHTAGFLNDLLPVPYTAASLECVIAHVDRVQTALGRQILIENPSTYLAFDESDLDEVDFIAEIARRSGCGLLLDVNNVFVASTNHDRDPARYIDRFPMRHVGEIHLAGHVERHDANGAAFLIDSHNRPVCEEVWALYRRALSLAGPTPTLIERDADIPDWPTLYAEARRAHALLSDADSAIARGAALDLAC